MCNAYVCVAFESASPTFCFHKIMIEKLTINISKRETERVDPTNTKLLFVYIVIYTCYCYCYSATATVPGSVRQ